MRAGQAVRDNSNGDLGIVTEVARKSGVYKGKVGVMWEGSPYSVIESPENLTPVKLAIKEEGTK